MTDKSRVHFQMWEASGHVFLLFCYLGSAFVLFLLPRMFFSKKSAGNAIIYFVMVFHDFLKNVFVFKCFVLFCPIFILFCNGFLFWHQTESKLIWHVLQKIFKNKGPALFACLWLQRREVRLTALQPQQHFACGTLCL